jgi:hypothetical protein
LKGLIEADLHKGVRSERDFDAVVGMLAVGLDEEMIGSIFDQYPVGDKYREAGARYLSRTISLAYDAVKVVRIKYADLNEYEARDGSKGVDRRLQLCFVVEEGTDVGAMIRCGITVPTDNGKVEERWVKFFEACGLKAPVGAGIENVKRELIGRKLRLEVDSRGRRTNPVVAFYKDNDKDLGT